VHGLATSTVPPKIIKDIGTVVVTGSLNPPAVQPWWLAHLGLISPLDAESAKIDGISTEFSVFELAWVRIEILRERFSATAVNIEADQLRLRDLVCGIFSALPHTPVTALGINRIVHYEMPSSDGYHLIGDTLAPKEFWKRHMKGPGLKSLTLRGERSDDQPGEINVTVKAVLSQKDVIEVSYNNHLQFPAKGVGKDVAPMLERGIEAALNEGTAIAKSLIDELGVKP
jgi:hypothetical protein